MLDLDNLPTFLRVPEPRAEVRMHEPPPRIPLDVRFELVLVRAARSAAVLALLGLILLREGCAG